MVYQVLGSLGLQMHPDKTLMGRIEKGFSFLGYQLSPTGLSVAQPTLDKLVARALWLDERERGEGEAASPLAAYVQRWMRWVQTGIDSPVKINGLKLVVAAGLVEPAYFLNLCRPLGDVASTLASLALSLPVQRKSIRKSTP